MEPDSDYDDYFSPPKRLRSPWHSPKLPPITLEPAQSTRAAEFTLEEAATKTHALGGDNNNDSPYRDIQLSPLHFRDIPADLQGCKGIP
ncbi:hypothetical protein M758_UG208900 [Ceratodon purpureus]|nr:hypothetical protein M758_UG208900 [Ceratodon purpureus]